METTIDKAGRIVVPKAIRDSLGLTAGTRLEVLENEGELVVRPVGSGVRIEKKEYGPVIVADSGVAPLTAGQVRELLERTRR